MSTAPPIGTILWSEDNAAHYNHIHVEPPFRMKGSPPLTNPGMTDGVKLIYDALEERFGKGNYFVDPPAGTQWTHMGGWNRRPIAGSTIWSQHAWWNALDIGPLYGVAEQQEVYDFLTGKEQEMAFTADEEKELKGFVAALKLVDSNAGFVVSLIPDMRKGLITNDELQTALKGISAGTVDQTARDLAKAALAKLAAVDAALG